MRLILEWAALVSLLFLLSLAAIWVFDRIRRLKRKGPTVTMDPDLQYVGVPPSDFLKTATEAMVRDWAAFPELDAKMIAAREAAEKRMREGT